MIAIERAAFERYVGERAAASERSQVRAAELYLACACSFGDRRALAEFESRYLGAVPAFLARTGAGPELVDEVRQELRDRLFVQGKIQQYSGRGSLAGWLRSVTLRTASNLRSRMKSHAALDETIACTAVGPELDAIHRHDGDAIALLLRDALAALGPEDSALFRLHFIEGLNIGRVAAVLQVSRATIGRRVIALRTVLTEGVRRLVCDRFDATPAEAFGLLHAYLHLNRSNDPLDPPHERAAQPERDECRHGLV
jgi:RNA polymerase sigma-70 factor (ECF subfamily)